MSLEELLEAALRHLDATLRGRNDHWDAMLENAAATFDAAAAFVAGAPSMDAPGAQLLIDRTLRVSKRLREVRQPRKAASARALKGVRAFHRGAAALVLGLNAAPDDAGDLPKRLVAYAQGGIQIFRHGESPAQAAACLLRLEDALRGADLGALAARGGGGGEGREALALCASGLEFLAEALRRARPPAGAAGAAGAAPRRIGATLQLMADVTERIGGDAARVAHVAHFHGRCLCSADDFDDAIDCLRLCLTSVERAQQAEEGRPPAAAADAEAPTADASLSDLQCRALFALCFCFAQRRQCERALLCLETLEQLRAGGGAPAAAESDVCLAKSFVHCASGDLSSARGLLLRLLRSDALAAGAEDKLFDAARRYAEAARHDGRGVALAEEIFAALGRSPAALRFLVEALLRLDRSPSGAADAAARARALERAAELVDGAVRAGGAGAWPPRLRRELWLAVSRFRAEGRWADVEQWCRRLCALLEPRERAPCALWQSEALARLGRPREAMAKAMEAMEQRADEAAIRGAFLCLCADAAVEPRAAAARVLRLMEGSEVRSGAERAALLEFLAQSLHRRDDVPARRKAALTFELLALHFVQVLRLGGDADRLSVGEALCSLLKAALLKVDFGRGGEARFLKGDAAAQGRCLKAAEAVCERMGGADGDGAGGVFRAEDLRYAAFVLWNVAVAAAEPRGGGAAAPEEEEGEEVEDPEEMDVQDGAEDLRGAPVPPGEAPLRFFAAAATLLRALSREQLADAERRDVAEKRTQALLVVASLRLERPGGEGAASEALAEAQQLLDGGGAPAPEGQRGLLAALRVLAAAADAPRMEALLDDDEVVGAMAPPLLLAVAERLPPASGAGHRLYRAAFARAARPREALHAAACAFRAAQSTDDAIGALDDAVRVLREAEGASAGAEELPSYGEWLTARAHNRGLALLELRDAQTALQFLTRSVTLLGFAPDAFKEEVTEDIMATLRAVQEELEQPKRRARFVGEAEHPVELFRGA